MMKISKTVLYKSKMLMSFFIATVIIVVSIPAVVSDPPETEECMGSISPNNVIPTTPGFRYDPDEYIVVTGEISASAELWWPLRDDYSSYDSASFDAEYPLQKYGPNVIGDSELVFAHAENGSDNTYLAASALMGTGYAISANIKTISFSASSTSNSVAEGSSGPSWGGSAQATEDGWYRPLYVSFPFSVSESGILFVEEAALILLGGVSGHAEGGLASSWTYDCYVGASWEIRKVGEGVIAGDTYSLSDFGSTDDYDGPREIPLPAGDYIFSASYDSYLYGSIFVRGGINNPASAAVNAFIDDGRFAVTLNYFPEE